MVDADRGSVPSRHERAQPDQRLGRIGWGLALIGVGVVWLLIVLGVEVPWELVLPALLVVVGLAILAIGRRAHGDGLITLGLVVAAITLLTSFAPGTLSASIGERTDRLSESGQLDEHRALGVGSLTIDLREVDLPDGVTRISAGVTVGELIVRIPADVAIAGEARAVIGEVTTLDRSWGGVAPRSNLPSVGTDGPLLELDLAVGIGRVEVRP